MGFNTTSGAIIARELMIAYLNTGTTAVPVWSPIGSRVTDSSEELDWSLETTQDILGTTRTTMKKPVITQNFDPFQISADDAVAEYLHDLAVVDQDYASLASQDVMIWHKYDENNFAERYSGSAIQITGLGGEGGGSISMPFTITYGGTRTVGTAAADSTTGVVTFTPAT